MIRRLFRRLENLPHNQRGTSLVAYAVLLGGIAVALAAGLVDFSGGVTTALTNEASHIATIAGTSSGSSTTSPGTPTSGSTPGTPTSAPGSGKGSGKGKRR
ncbi:MAG: hypothetical protein WD733_12200 [Bryobacterales bacterium]